MTRREEHVSQASETEIRDLIGNAGPRPAVPEEHLGKIRAAAEEQWRELVRLEDERSRFGRRNTLLALAASLLLALGLGWWLMPDWSGTAPDLVASLELVRGEARVDEAPALAGGSVAAGAVVTTSAGGDSLEGAGVAIRLRGGQSVRLDAGSEVRLVSGSQLELERGALYVDTIGAAGASALEVSTRYGLVRDIGTQFEVRVGSRSQAGLTVRVREGAIELASDGKSHTAQAGEALRLTADADVEKSSIAPHDAAWHWVESVAPVMDIEGASLASYLEWVARETGRTVRYADQSLEHAASESIRLHGTIEGSTPEESLGILPSSGLRHRVENGWLLIERP